MRCASNTKLGTNLTFGAESPAAALEGAAGGAEPPTAAAAEAAVALRSAEAGLAGGLGSSSFFSSGFSASTGAALTALSRRSPTAYDGLAEALDCRRCERTTSGPEPP